MADTSRPDPETDWLERVYQGESGQLTVRAVIGGMAIGALKCLSNLYVFFKTGWSMGVTLTACILAFASFQGLKAIKLVRRPLNVCAGTCGPLFESTT